MFFSIILSGCSRNYRLIVGGFTGSDVDTGLTVFNFNSGNGDLKVISRSDAGPNPSYLCYSEKNDLFYAINEVMEFNGEKGGGVTTFKINEKDGDLIKLNEMLIPYGGPCFLSLAAGGGYLFLANYPNGSVVVIKNDKDGIPSYVTDTILYVRENPDSSHAHMILPDPSGERVYVTDLGLDRVSAYNFDPNTGKINLIENGIAQLPEGDGPRHFEFNSDGSMMYVINELGSTMVVYNVNASDELTLLQRLPTTKSGFEGVNYCADIHISKDGRFLYGSNRGENTIVTFRIGRDGLLELAGHTSCGGDWPRNFTLDPTGRFLLVGNQKSDYISVFRIDRKTGMPYGDPKNVEVNKPACLKFY